MTIRMRRPLRERLRKDARRLGRSDSAFARDLIERGLEEKERSWFVDSSNPPPTPARRGDSVAANYSLSPQILPTASSFSLLR